MYNVATILPLWVYHFQHPYHHPHSPTKRCPLRLFLREMFSGISRHALFTNTFIILSHPISSCDISAPMKLSGIISSSYHKCQEGSSKVWMYFQIGKFLGKLQNVLIKNSSLSLSNQLKWWRVSFWTHNVIQQEHSASVTNTQLYRIVFVPNNLLTWLVTQEQNCWG